MESARILNIKIPVFEDFSNHDGGGRVMIVKLRRPEMDIVPHPHVLVVDDDPAIRGLLTAKLHLSGFIPRSCGSGEEALKILSNESFDAIISDLNMPGISGLELLAEAHHLVPHTAFLMATGVDDVSVGVAAMKQGAADYILKPFQMEAAMASLRRALEMKRMEAELEAYRLHLESMVEERTRQLRAALSRIERTYDETLEALAAALDLRDNDTAGHSRRVTLYSLEMAMRLNFSTDQLKQLERGAYLHDIGKIGIPDSILLKPAKLTPEEMAIMQSHVQIGFDLMNRVEFLSTAAQIVLAHQERFDGTGYPQGLRGEEIPLGARIFAIADTMDAMMSDRPYRQGRPFEVARAEIQREAGRQFDPQVVAEFLAVPPETWAKIRSDSVRTPSEKKVASAGELAAKQMSQ
jgi:response regulator RpfG family c-di-GMP phosphodiesterase